MKYNLYPPLNHNETCRVVLYGITEVADSRTAPGIFMRDTAEISLRDTVYAFIVIH